LSITITNDNSNSAQEHTALAEKRTTPTMPLTTQTNVNNMDNNDNFLTYENSSLGIKIHYPSDWSIERLQNNLNSTILPIVRILPPIAQDPNATAGLTVGIDTNPTTNNSLDRYLRDLINNYRNPLTNMTDFKLISASTSNITLGGNSAYTLLYSWNRGDDLGPTETIETGTMVGNKVYYIMFSTAAAEYSTLIPTVKQIINSFAITMPQPNGITPKNYNNNSTASINNTTAAKKNATTSTTNNFLTYENTTFGIKIEYPSEWVMQESHDHTYGFGTTEIVNFTSPGAVVRIIFVNGGSQNMSLEQLKNQVINNLKRTGPGNINITLSKPITLSDIPAYEVVYDALSSLSSGIPVKVMQIWTLQNRGEYALVYVSSPSNFSSALPIVQRMIESLQISNINQQQQMINANQISFSTYQNSSLGIKIQYPSSWNILGPFSEKNGTVSYISFIAPIGSSSVDIFTKNSSLTSNYSEDDINKIKQELLSSQQDSRLISSAAVTLANGDPAYKMIFTRVIYPRNSLSSLTNNFSITNNEFNFTKLSNINPIKLQSLVVFSTKADKPYAIGYNAALADYDRYHAITQKMLDSFQISPRAQASNPTISGAFCSLLPICQ
jgi:hypothetical protein